MEQQKVLSTYLIIFKFASHLLNQDIIKTLWKIGLYFENNGQINEAKTNLLEALELAEEIEGRRTVEGLPASDLGKAIYVYQVDPC